MGRVDEAMRRAAEAAGHLTPNRPDDDGPAAPAQDLDALTSEPYPTETERPRLRPVGPVAAAAGPGPTAANARTQMIPPLADRMDARLSRKVVIDREMDAVSREQYRRLAAGLHSAQAAGDLKVVMLASAVASEGKSLTSSNLAMTFSESYHRNVLLIDGDLRRPSLHTIFGLDACPGLGEGLAAPEDRKLPLHRVTSRLTVLTAGTPTTDPMSALSSDRMRRLVEEARETFDWVVIDTPPIGLLSDASLLSQIADGAILVVRARSTPYELVQRAIASLGRERLLGVVLNQAEAPRSTEYQYQAYYQSSGGRQSYRA